MAKSHATLQKTCPRCGEAKGPEGFYLNRGRADGLSVYCAVCSRAVGAHWRKGHPERWNEHQRKARRAAGERIRKYNREHLRELRRVRKRRIVAEYGGKCECCGETNWEFLTIDHIGGGGNQHRRRLKKHGSEFYQWLVKSGYPKAGFRLLCFNCNSSAGHYGYCPHAKPPEG